MCQSLPFPVENRSYHAVCDGVHWCWKCFSQNDVSECAQHVASLDSQLSSRMQQLHTTVQSKNAVPTAQVYVSMIDAVHLLPFSENTDRILLCSQLIV